MNCAKKEYNRTKNIDLIALLIIAVAFIFITYKYGKSYLTAFILSFYPTYFLFDLLKDTYVNSKDPLVIVGIFLASFALIMYILRRTIQGGFSFTPTKRWIDAIALTLGAITQLAFVYYHVLPQLGDLYNLSKVIDSFVNGTVPYLALAAAPFVALFISARD
jgi:hypothetical protein